MVSLTTVPVICFLLARLVKSSPLEAGLHFSPFHRQARSGGYPKFPLNEYVPTACGTRDVSHEPTRAGQPSAKIVGGSIAPYGAYPWQVEIKQYRPTQRRFEHHCGGAVVGPRLVLTAAHCLQNEDIDQLRVVVGDYHLQVADKHEQSFRVERVLVHPDFRKLGPYSNDIGLIKVRALSDGGISFNSHVKPICLPELQAKSTAGSWCSVTGWGAQRPEDVDSSLSQVLQVAAVPLLDLNTCRRADVYGGRRQSILDSMLCAGRLEGGVDACGGDSGGPLACEINGRFVLMGIVSWGDGCAQKNRPGVYTRVSHYADWIQTAKQTLGVP
ncbi:serine protease 33-like [Periplaneta americana]|uniref:serine protease 33-like n=1 Tax=Periplaneta americana TaxID=6978 RepID=UPI0037E9AA34